MALQQPLAKSDGNRQSAKVVDPHAEKPVPAFAQEARQRQTLHSKLMRQEQSGKQADNYVSPSDDILSPASAKLNAFKEKRFAKSAKPRALFAKSATQMDAERQNSEQQGA